MRHRWRLSVALWLSVGVGALLFPGAALADHLYEESFGSDGSEASIFEGFGSRTIGVDQSSGAIYVLNHTFEPHDETIYKFDENHQPANFAALGSNKISGVPSSGAEGRSQVAVDAASHRIYVTQELGSLTSIRAFEANGEPAEFSALKSDEIGGFSELCGVAVDQNGDIYAADLVGERVTVFAPSGAELTHFTVSKTSSPESGPCNLGVDSAGAVYVTHWRSSVQKFTPSTFPVTAATTYTAGATIDPGPAYSLAVNPASDHLYVDRGSRVVEYDGGGKQVGEPFGSVGEGALALSTGIAVRGVGLAERIYIVDLSGNQQAEVFGPHAPLPRTGKASEVKRTTATLSGTVNPEGVEVSACSFEYVKNAEYDPQAKDPYAGGGSAPCVGQVPTDSADHPVSADLSTLALNTKYHFRLAASNAAANAKGEDETFETLGPPRIDSESAAEVGTTTARISGLIDPRGETSSFAVEYVSEADFLVGEYAKAITVPVPAAEVGAGIGDVEVGQEVAGLNPGTAYHYRLLAANLIDPPVHGPDQVFTTFAEAGGGLPDGRAYELVSPAAKFGEVFPPDTSGLLDGSCKNCLPGYERIKMPMQPAPDGGAIAYEGQSFGANISATENEYLGTRGAGGWETEPLSKPFYDADTAFPDQAEGFVAFSSDLSRGIISQISPSLAPEAPADFANLYLWQRGMAALQPLITKAPPNRLAGNSGENSFQVIYAGANSGAGAVAPFSHVVFEANDSLTAKVAGSAPAAPPVSGGARDLYEWSAGQLHLVNVLPGNGGAVADAVIGSGRLLTNAQNEGPVFAHAISADGSRIFWSSKASGQVYLRVGGKETREIPDHAGKFLSAAADGSRVLLDDGHLYDTSSAVPTQIADLSAGQGGFQGILGAGEDLSRVYFVDTAALTPPTQVNENPAGPEHAEANKDNLYVWQGGTSAFIGQLSPRDNEFGGFSYIGDWRPAPGNRTAQVSGDGRYLAFMSSARLSGYDNEQRKGQDCVALGSGPVCPEVFEYDAGAGKLSCASCNPAGERPLGFANLSLIDAGARAFFFAQPTNLTAGGRLFFESQDTLSPADQNGHIQDVYEWEPNEVGSCQRPSGCAALISSGHSPNDSFFLNATPSGDDAFIVTREQLLGRDKDDYLDLYDARAGGGFLEPPPIICLGREACRESPRLTPPAPPSPGSSTFLSPGNPKPKCHKHKKCHKPKKHHQAKKKHKRAVKNPNAGGSR